jgi:hypothetical protein
LKKLSDYVKHWSYSSWSVGQKCTLALWYAQVERLRGPPVPAMERGTMLHLLAENYLKGEIQGMPRALRKIEFELKQLKRKRPIVEQYWNLDTHWRKTNKKNGWAVAKLDACVLPTERNPVADVVDHKSGKEYEPEHSKQGSLYGTFTMGMYPFVETVHVAFFYIDQGYAPSYTYTRAKLNYTKQYWIEQGNELMATSKFIATPTPNGCRFCSFRSDKKLENGQRGPCNKWKGVVSRW